MVLFGFNFDGMLTGDRGDFYKVLIMLFFFNLLTVTHDQ